MKFLVLFLSIMLFFKFSAVAQDDNASLILQSAHGHSVKMLWFFKSWDAGFRGFDIKRKEGIQQDWVRLNKKVIYPSFSAKKDFHNVEPDKQESDRLHATAVKYISAHKIPELDSQTFEKKLFQDEHFLPEISKMVAQDYDLALMSGFAFIDRSPTRKIDYEYGLFDHETGNLLARASWNYGQVPDLNLITEITSRSTIGKRGILIWWSADQNKLKAGYVHGFNIYRDGIRLNQDPVMLPDNFHEGYEWFDSTANGTIPNQYSIASESMMDIEGIIKAYTYNPTDHPSTYKKPEVDEVSSLGMYLKDGIRLSWNFPAEYERFIVGYYVEKDNIPEGYKQVSPLLPPGVRGYVDKTSSPIDKYVRFKMVAVYKDRSYIAGKDHVYSYFPLREPPAPINFSETGVFKGKQYFGNFSWDRPMTGDSVTDYYQLYVLEGYNQKLSLVPGTGQIHTNFYSYNMKDVKTGENIFFLMSVGKNGAESKLSDTLVVTVPTSDPPRPTGIAIIPAENTQKIQWQYNDMFDLKGFRLFINNKLAIGEDSLKRNLRECVLNLEGGKNYEFKMQAVTTSNIVSELSDPAAINIPAPLRKKR